MNIPTNAMDRSAIEDGTYTIAPRYLRDKGAIAMFALSRTKLYTLAKEGKIKSISLQEKGTTRGTRLFCVESIQSYIESFATENAA